jgi:hypothetical protein
MANYRQATTLPRYYPQKSTPCEIWRLVGLYQESIAMKKGIEENPTFSIVFKKGKANQNRLPLGHVLSTLREIDAMIREVGKRVQQTNGMEAADGDFGIELLANKDGIAFKKGSVAAEAVLTKDLKNGLETIGKIIDLTDSVEKKAVRSVDQNGEAVLRRLTTISKFQERDKTELHFGLDVKQKPVKQTVLSQKGVHVLREMGKAELEVEAITLYGKLKALADFSKEDETKYFWGELREDNGAEWRVRFHITHLGQVQKLFTRQVVIAGNATYFQTKRPRVDAQLISEEKPRNYLTAFDKFRKEYRDVFGDTDPSVLLGDARG